MPLMDWNDQLRVGIAEMDEDHKMLLSIVNELAVGIRDGLPHEALTAILDRLVEANSAHFAREERLLAEHGFPELAAHKDEHDKISKWAVQTEFDFHHGNLSVPLSEVMNKIRTMILEHVCEADKCYAEFLHAKGIH